MSRCVEMILLVICAVSWIPSPSASERDFNTCSFYYWRVDWFSAVSVCENEGKLLLCYKSRKEIDDITEAFRLSAFGNAELQLWLSAKNCSSPKKEECLSLHITKSNNNIWHYIQKSCTELYPFVCCINGTEQPTTTTTTTQSTTLMTIESSPEDNYTANNFTSTSLPVTTTTTVNPYSCKKIWKRRILWPETEIGKFSVQPCPGRSVGEARWECTGQSVGEWEPSGPDMTKCRSLEIRNLKEKFNTSSASETIISLEQVFKDEDKEIFCEDLVDVITIMTALPDRLFNETGLQPPDERWIATKDSIEKSASVFDRIIELNTTWYDIVEERRPTIGSDLLSTVDNMGLLLADAMVENIEEQSIIGRNIALQVLKTQFGKMLELPQWAVTSHYSHKGNIILEKGYDSRLEPEMGNISVLFTLYNDMSSILSPVQKSKTRTIRSSLNSAVVSATVSQGRNPVTISSDVRIVMEHLVAEPNDTACVFWNLNRNLWDTEGCKLESTNASYSLCVCDHLTNFAILMDYQGVMDEVNQVPFFYITVIGCIISIICLTLCVIIFTCYSYHSKHSWGLRYVIHRNLCLTLLIANLVLLVGLDKTDNQRMCAVIAGLLHYFFLSAFSWMLLEGFHIYLLLVVVFASRRSHSEKYYIFGYGFPLIVVAITATSRPMYYGTDEACWLSVEKGTIWGFMGPVACILLVNTAALILAQWKASNISVKDDHTALVMRWLRVTFILFPVLGLTWVFGFLYVGKHFEVAGYLFAIFNSLQGFCIFIFHCVMDKKARNMVVSSLKKKSASVNTGSSGTQRKQKDPQLPLNDKNFNGIKNDTLNDNSTTNKKSKFSFKKNYRNSWTIWHKPWSFCFDMPVSDNESQGGQKEHEEIPPKPIMVQWTNLTDKTS